MKTVVPHPDRAPLVPTAHVRASNDLLPALTRSTVIVAGQFAAVFVSAMVPTPLYPLYRQTFGFGGVTLTLVTSAGSTPRIAMLGALILLPLSLGLLVLAEPLNLLWLMMTATAIGGIAAAFGYRGSLQVVNALAPADRRSEVVSAFLLVLFVGNSVPVIGISLLAAATSAATAHIAFAGVDRGVRDGRIRARPANGPLMSKDFSAARSADAAPVEVCR